MASSTGTPYTYKNLVVYRDSNTSTEYCVHVQSAGRDLWQKGEACIRHVLWPVEFPWDRPKSLIPSQKSALFGRNMRLPLLPKKSAIAHQHQALKRASEHEDRRGASLGGPWRALGGAAAPCQVPWMAWRCLLHEGRPTNEWTILDSILCTHYSLVKSFFFVKSDTHTHTHARTHARSAVRCLRLSQLPGSFTRDRGTSFKRWMVTQGFPEEGSASGGSRLVGTAVITQNCSLLVHGACCRGNPSPALLLV